jgi:hypothetical protein
MSNTVIKYKLSDKYISKLQKLGYSDILIEKELDNLIERKRVNKLIPINTLEVIIEHI